MKGSKLVLLIAGFLLTALASWGADLSQSNMDNLFAFGQNRYQELKTQAQKDHSKLFIQHLKEGSSPSDWPYLLDEAFKEKEPLITANDLFFIVKETSFAAPLDEKGLYQLVILNRLRHKAKMAAMVELLARPDIAMRLHYLGNDYRATLLAALLENGYIDAVTSIMNALAEAVVGPDLDVNPFPTHAVGEITFVDDPENRGYIYNGTKPFIEYVSFCDWLMRDEGIYLSGTKANPNYVKAAQAMLLYAEKSLSLEKKPVGVNSLASLCEKKKLLPESFDFASFAEINELKLKQEVAPSEEAKATEHVVAEPISCAPSLAECPTPTNTPEPFYAPFLRNLGNLLALPKD